MTDTTIPPQSSEDASLRWFVGVPVVTNPFMILDILTLAVLAFGGAMIFITAGQELIGGGLSRSALMAAAAYAGYVGAAVIACFLGFGIALLGNRYAALFRLDDRGVYQEVMRGGRRAAPGSGPFACRPFALEPLVGSSRRPRLLPWADIRGAQGVPALRTILLRGKRGGTAMKVYCPDEHTYTTALAAITARLSLR